MDHARLGEHIRQSHAERLDALPDCETYDGQGACKMGNIIIEGHSEGHVVEIWQREQ